MANTPAATTGSPRASKEAEAGLPRDVEKTAAIVPHQPPQQQQDQVTGFRLFTMLLSLSLACFLIMLDTSVMSTAVPKITDDFHSLRDVGWYASSYQLGSTVLQLMTGKIYSFFALKWSFLSFFFVFELGSALSGAAQSSSMLIASRAVSGIGASGLINGALTMMSAAVPLERRAGKCLLLAALTFSLLLAALALSLLLAALAFSLPRCFRKSCVYYNNVFGLILPNPHVLASALPVFSSRNFLFFFFCSTSLVHPCPLSLVHLR